MNCEQVRELLSAYFDGEIPVNRTALAAGSDPAFAACEEPAASVLPLTEQIREHVAGCDACAIELRSYVQLRGLVSAQPMSKISPPSWESISTRLDSVSGTSLAIVSDNVARLDTNPVASTVPNTRSRRMAIGGLLTLAASALLFFSLRNAQQHKDEPINQASLATINLQPLMELFKTDAEKAIATLASQHPTEDVTLAKAEIEFGRPTFVQASARTHSLPGNAHLVSTKLMQFPYCKCPKGACTCGPGGCNCVACLCERPDGSTYLVLEQCKSQSVTFGDLPVQLVKRGDRHLQQVEAQGTTAISWEQDGERLTAIGVRGPEEIDSLLARN